MAKFDIAFGRPGSFRYHRIGDFSGGIQMDALFPLIAGLAGAVFGAGVAWLFHRSVARSIKDQADAEAKAESATAYERLRAAEDQLRKNDAEYRELQGRYQDIVNRFNEHTAKLSSAEERVTNEQRKVAERHERIGVLEAEVKDRDTRIEQLRTEYATLNAENSKLRTTIEKEQENATEKLELLKQAETKLSDVFRSLSAQALQHNNNAFLDLAKENLQKFQQSAQGDLESRKKAIDQLVKPLNESLEKIHLHIGEVEKSRSTAYTQLTEQVRSMAASQENLRSETSKLVRALQSPIARGRWGEIQLRRVAEMAGMLDHCDFKQQESAQTEGGRLRPDMIIKLPNGRNIVVDSKVSLHAYLNAVEAPDEATKKIQLKDHARQVRDHIKNLSSKEYWSQFTPTPEFVVLFLPGEPFFSAALEHDPTLIEMGVDHNVIIATPTTLIALLRAVAYGWRQEQLAENAQAISELGQQLYERIRNLAEHFEGIRKNLTRATESYNRAVGTLESRVLVTARKFKELAASKGTDIDLVDGVDVAARRIQAEELAKLPAPDNGEN